MMTFNELWEEIRKKNERISTGTVQMSSSSFQRALRYAYKKGAESVVDNIAKAKESDALWNKLFGGKNKF